MSEETYNMNSREGQEEEPKKRGGGGCSGSSSSSSSSSDSVPGSGGEDGMGNGGLESGNAGDVDFSINQMCKKVYTVYRSLPKSSACPIAQRDNLADQYTPQHDLLTMEKTVRDFLKLESKIYDPETTNPRFFASEQWVQHYEKDKNVILASLDQYKANIKRMQNLYDVVDMNSYNVLKGIPNQDTKSSFQTNILWTSRALKDWINNWFIQKTNSYSTQLWSTDHWMPDLTGQMISWMKLGSYKEFNPIATSNELSLERVDKLEGMIDRLMNSQAVQKTISNYIGAKEKIEQKASQKEDKTFTSKIIDSTMGKKLGVTDTGTTNEKPEGTVYVAPKEDQVEDINLICKLSCVKSLFQSFRTAALSELKSCRCVSASGPGPYPQIWTKIDELANPVYGDLEKLNDLIEDRKNDSETPGKHCSVTHTKICPKQLKKRITTFKCIIKQGVIDVIVNQILLPKKGLNILDSMFNQLWEQGEKGPSIEMPSWCQEAIECINGFEDAMLDAWDEVYDCWEREFLTRLWRIEVEHHTNNWVRTQTMPVTTLHDHTHPFIGAVTSHAIATGTTMPSPGGDGMNIDTIPMNGYLCCPGHLSDLLKPVCVCYKLDDIEPLAQNYRAHIKALCQWMVSAIQAVGIKQSAISAAMANPSLNGCCGNAPFLAEINNLKTKNDVLLKKVETAYGIYSDVNNMKNKKEYDDQIALHEIQPNQYSNEDQLNMSSSIQSESKEFGLSAELCQGGIDIGALKPWKHMSLSPNKVEPKPIPAKCVCNKFDKIIKTMAGFESAMNIEN